jgi:hypothetical protein
MLAFLNRKDYFCGLKERRNTNDDAFFILFFFSSSAQQIIVNKPVKFTDFTTPPAPSSNNSKFS